MHIGSELLQVTGGERRRPDDVDGRRAASRGRRRQAAAEGRGGDADRRDQDRQFLDFSPSAAFSVYNWELFYHIPLYIAQLLSQNQQFEDAQTWFHYIFDPTRQGTDPGAAALLDPEAAAQPDQRRRSSAQQINKLLDGGQPGRSRPPSRRSRTGAADPFNPFLLADLRPVCRT